MQVHAFDRNQRISSHLAEKGRDYTCPQCLATVRLRGGDLRQKHFFHTRKNRSCRLSQKGLIHLKLQQHLQSLFEGARMEMAFPSIGRIADVAHPSAKIVYEIQYSPMSLEEAKGRCKDYEALGWTVIWILHDQTFNKGRRRPVERFLRSKICYYSNMDRKGNGVIYDCSGPYQPICPVNLAARRSPIPSCKWPALLTNRAKTWTFYHEGDLFDRTVNGRAAEPPRLKKRGVVHLLKELYLLGLHSALERSSR